MDIVIVGAGRVGHEIAARLSEEGHSVTVIDNDEGQVSYISDSIDVMTVLGNGADYTVLAGAGVGQADLVIAVTNNDAVNMLCCLSAKKLGAKNAVARVRTMEYYRQMVFLKDELGLSLVFNPEMATASEISRILRFPSAANVESFAKGRAEMLQFTVESDTPLDGLRLNKLRGHFGSGILVCAVVHHDQVVIPKGEYTLSAGDTAYVVGAPGEVSTFFKSAGMYRRSVRNAMLLGGGRIALYLGTELISAGIRVKIIEKNEEHCTIIKNILPKAEVLHGDGTDPKVLEEEGIRTADAFVALTGSDQANIITSMFAKRSGAGKVITKLNEDFFRRMIDDHGLDSFVSPKSVAADDVVSYVRAIQNSMDVSGILALHEIAGGKAESLEFTITGDHEYIGKPLKQLQIRHDTILAAIIRGNTCIIPGGDDSIKRDDNIIAVTTRFGMQRFDDIFGE